MGPETVGGWGDRLIANGDVDSALEINDLPPVMRLVLDGDLAAAGKMLE